MRKLNALLALSAAFRISILCISKIALSLGAEAAGIPISMSVHILMFDNL